MEANFVFEQVINLGNHIFSYGERKHPEMCAHSIPRSCVSLPHAAGASWAFSFTFFYNYLQFSMVGNPFLVLHSEWEKRFMIWGFIEVIYAPVRPINVF